MFTTRNKSGAEHIERLDSPHHVDDTVYELEFLSMPDKIADKTIKTSFKNVESLIFDEGCGRVGPHVFENLPKLKRIIILGTARLVVNEKNFSNCPNLDMSCFNNISLRRALISSTSRPNGANRFLARQQTVRQEIAQQTALETAQEPVRQEPATPNSSLPQVVTIIRNVSNANLYPSYVQAQPVRRAPVQQPAQAQPVQAQPAQQAQPQQAAQARRLRHLQRAKKICK